MSQKSSELRPLLRLSVPLIVGNAGNSLMGVVDTLMIGRVSTAALGGVGLGNAVFFMLSLVATGCAWGMDAPVSQALGAGEQARARRIFWQGVRVVTLASIPVALLIGLLPLVFVPIGVDPDLAREASHYVWARLPSLWPLLYFITCRSYLQAQHVTRPMLVSMAIANVVNVIGNGLFIYGDGALAYVGLPGVGLPALGAVGAAMSTVLAQLVSLWVVTQAVRGLEAPPDPDRRKADPAMIRTIFRLGIPLGLQNLAEIGVFTLCNVLAGRMSEHASAGHQLAITLASFSFMFALGVGAATSVRVGHAVGRGDTPAARRAGFTGLGLILMIMLPAAIIFMAFGQAIASLFTDDPRVIETGGALLFIAAVFQLSDGVQAVAAGALRGAGDHRFPLWANVVGHWAVGLPISIGLGLALAWGAPGLWWGLSAGLTAVAIALTLRFRRVSSREIRRV